MRHLLVCSVAAIALAGCHAAPGNESAPIGNATTQAAPTPFKVDKVSLPGEGRGDYLTIDTDANRLYVTHSAAVHVLDLTTLKPLFQVDGLKAAHGVALDAARGHGFVTDGKQNAVVMFDLATGKTIKTIPAGTKPDSIVHDLASGMIFAFNGESSDVSVIDPAKAEVVKTIKLPNGPEFSQSDGLGKVWVNLEEGNAIAEIDTKTLTLARTIKLDGCEGPGPLAFDPTDRLLFTGCTGNSLLAVVDPDSGKIIATAKVGEDPDGIAFDDAKDRIFVANRKGGWTIIDQADRTHYALNQTLPIDEYAKTVSVDPRTHRAFSSTADLIWPKGKAGDGVLPEARPGSFRLMVVSEK
jgi:DNA-binding beta-propeller fold protein YncE